jgi:hypothetical protein
MAMERQLSTLEQEVGVALLDMGQHLWDLVPHKSETVQIMDHERAIRRARVQVDLHAFAGEATERWPPWEDLPDTVNLPRPRRSLVRWRGRILIPIALLRPGTDDTPDVTNEAGELVPSLPENEVRLFLRAGLIATARTALGRQPLEPNLFKYLWETAQPSYREIDKYIHGPRLITHPGFRTALVYATGYRYLVVPVNPDRGPRRVFTSQYIQPINQGRKPSQPQRSTTRFGRAWAQSASLIDRFASSGHTEETIPLGDISNCRRYELEVEAPYDTLYHDASMDIETLPESSSKPTKCDCSHRTKIRFAEDNEPIPKTGLLTAQLYALRTGVIRSSTVSAPFTLVILALGSLYATFMPGHVVGRRTEDAATALLLLFAGVIGGVLAAPSKHPVTATIQFPTRVVLWTIGAVSFFPAAVVALGIRGLPALAVWYAATAVCAFATAHVIVQWCRLKPTVSPD